jgi:hypothetical protein
MNVNLDYFISTDEQLNIFIEALELYLKDNSTVYYSSYIEELIKNLKKKRVFFKNLKKNKFLTFS